jgi:ABC-type Mn2+/Zn2+ transport system ATPase subunit
MITATGLELRVSSGCCSGTRPSGSRRATGSGLVGRNGAGKTTLTRVLSGESQPAAGTVTRSGSVGYLPQDPRTGDLEVLARDRILSARGLDTVVRRMRTTEGEMASADAETHEKAMRRYPRLEAEFQAAGGYAAESEAASFASSLGLPDRVLEQPLRTLSGGQRRRVELSRILFASTGSDATLLLDEPTNHLDADSIVWLRDYLGSYKGGLVVISHDVGLLEHTVTRVFHLDANRAELDIYNVGWKAYLLQAGDRRAPSQARAGQRREAGLGAQGPGRPDALQGHQGPRRPRAWTSAPPSCCPVWTRCAGPTGSPSCASPSRRRAARRRSPLRGCRSPTARSRCSPTSTWPSTGAAGWSSWASTARARPP